MTLANATKKQHHTNNPPSLLTSFPPPAPSNLSLSPQAAATIAAEATAKCLKPRPLPAQALHSQLVKSEGFLFWIIRFGGWKTFWRGSSWWFETFRWIIHFQINGFPENNMEPAPNQKNPAGWFVCQKPGCLLIFPFWQMPKRPSTTCHFVENQAEGRKQPYTND